MKVEVGITACIQMVVEVDDDMKPGTGDFSDAVDNAVQEALPVNIELQSVDVMRPQGEKAIWTGGEEE